MYKNCCTTKYPLLDFNLYAGIQPTVVCDPIVVIRISVFVCVCCVEVGSTSRGQTHAHKTESEAHRSGCINIPAKISTSFRITALLLRCRCLYFGCEAKMVALPSIMLHLIFSSGTSSTALYSANVAFHSQTGKVARF